VSDGTRTAHILLLGQFAAGQFTPASDGHGGTLISDPQLTSAPGVAPAAVIYHS
jgi:hypothetical protein